LLVSDVRGYVYRKNRINYMLQYVVFFRITAKHQRYAQGTGWEQEAQLKLTNPPDALKVGQGHQT